MFRFRWSSIFLFFVTISVAVGWFVDRQRLLKEIDKEHPLIRYYCEKANLWCPSEFLHRNTDELEAQLSNRIDGFAGDFVTSSQGMGYRRLRQPTRKTLDDIIGLLDDPSTRVMAAELTALYLESVSGTENSDESLTIKAHFQRQGLPKVRALMNDKNVDVRRALALICGNTLRSRETEEFLADAFDKEPDQSVRLHLSWSYYNITR